MSSEYDIIVLPLPGIAHWCYHTNASQGGIYCVYLVTQATFLCVASVMV